MVSHSVLDNRYGSVLLSVSFFLQGSREAHGRKHKRKTARVKKDGLGVEPGRGLAHGVLVSRSRGRGVQRLGHEAVKSGSDAPTRCRPLRIWEGCGGQDRRSTFGFEWAGMSTKEDQVCRTEQVIYLNGPICVEALGQGISDNILDSVTSTGRCENKQKSPGFAA
ncbi:hypothetical protein NDU88_004716 [Pleurodeles waltl]|uniref:Uncharacterized protein n=1 Tax=Pleurodeles waltl TaxID=8319 RepID=A0AAV7KZ69_PLEWA|nr:hypothetical protein NDU88_004716 [Pleurodeles waltl]